MLSILWARQTLYKSEVRIYIDRFFCLDTSHCREYDYVVITKCVHTYDAREKVRTEVERIWIQLEIDDGYSYTSIDQREER